MRALAWATTLSTLMPSFSSATAPGALAPNRSMPIETSAHFAHPNVAAASTDMRASIDDLTGKLLREVKEYREKRRNEPRRKAERNGG